jgi:glyoxylase-like metal-dependent hydrolase (beta-lactamase superfamily II)
MQSRDAAQRSRKCMNQIPLPDSARAEHPEADEVRDDKTRQIAPDVAYRQIAIVNVIFFGPPGAGDGQWVLIDAGVTGSASAIRSAAQARFGQTGRPSAIILTHGHFDHVGSLETLAAEWDVPVYAHRLEHPYLDGTTSYPPADPGVGGGLMALLSPFYPTSPIDVSPRLQALPDDHSIPGMPGWHWLHTPGHSPGHVSLWRNADRLLIAGDAFVTTKHTPQQTAVIEAYEEAGVLGDIGETEIGRFRKRKQRKNQQVVCEVQIFPLEVTRQQNHWPEKQERSRMWVAPREAAKLGKKAGLRRAIKNFGDQD